MQVSTNLGGTLEFARAAALNPDVSFTFRHFQALSNELALAKVLHCPADKKNLPAPNFAALHNGNVSYWVNPAAAFGRSDSPIAGDRNVRTSGRTVWTFIQFNSGDVVEFSAELHGHRGNVLFGDGHVDVLDGAALRTAFTSGSNSVDATLALPRSEVTETLPDGSTTQASRADSPNPRQSNDSAKRSSNAASANMTQSNRQEMPGSLDRHLDRSPRGDADELVVVTRLDGTFITSSIPNAVTNRWSSESAAPMERSNSGNPFIEFVHWLSRLSARATYWLLFFLLVALVAFQVARRRAQRKRGGAD